MKVDGIYLAGLGGCLPPPVSTDTAVAEGWYDPTAQDASRMESVAVAGPVAAPDLAVQAAEEALAQAGHRPEEYAALLHSATYHQGPDGWSAPHYVLRHTLNRPVEALEIRQGCVGMIASLQIAAHRLIADPAHPAVLLTNGDNFSVPLIDRWRGSRLFLLADGAAAAVVSRRPGFAQVLAVGSVSIPAMEELHRGGEDLFPPGITVGRSLDFEERSAWWRAQWARGITPPLGHLGDAVIAAVDRALTDAGITLDQVTRTCQIGYSWPALHDIFLDPLGLDPDRSSWSFTRRTGHVGAADPFLGLRHLWTTGQVVPGDHVLLVGAGPGMQASCAVVSILTGPDSLTVLDPVSPPTDGRR